MIEIIVLLILTYLIEVKWKIKGYKDSNYWDQ